ncbi:MAG: hypothetical protein HY721_25995 [Planctomycetes bacterium]|nr:hypothetical protein [Planctomycetota bacterium]
MPTTRTAAPVMSGLQSFSPEVTSLMAKGISERATTTQPRTCWKIPGL